MSRALTLSLLLSLSSTALAAKNELSLELGSLGIDDPEYELFSSRSDLPSSGLRAGLAVHDRVAVVADWQHTRRGASISTGGGDEFRAAFFGNAFALGAKVDIPVRDWLFPYVLAQGLIYQSTIKLDGDPNIKGNADELKRGAIAPGGLFALGVEAQVVQVGPLAAALHFELGYGLVNALDFPDYGAIRPGGVLVRGGVGVRF